MASHFQVIEHIVPGQHIRELHNALCVDDGSPEATVRLHVRQYIPKNNLKPQAGDITIIALHANTFCKELYEPLWNDLLTQLPAGVKLRGIWMADCAQQGESYVLNESKLADGISWDDHPRDLLCIINHFRHEMKPPLLGIGHSMGAAQLVGLCKLHPRLLHSVSLLDGFMWANRASPPEATKLSTSRGLARKDCFDSLTFIKKTYKKAPLFRAWDSRVFDIYCQTAFRSLPTLLYPLDAVHPNKSKPSDCVALKTPTAMEFYTTVRPNVDGINDSSRSGTRHDRLRTPDLVYDLPLKSPFYFPFPRSAGDFLPHLRSRALFLYATKGSIVTPSDRKFNLERAGTDSGGSGGTAVGAVEEDLVIGSHFFPFENPEGTAKRLGQWLQDSQKAWQEEKEKLDQYFQRHGTSAQDRQRIPTEFSEVVKTWDGRDRSKL